MLNRQEEILICLHEGRHITFLFDSYLTQLLPPSFLPCPYLPPPLSSSLLFSAPLSLQTIDLYGTSERHRVRRRLCPLLRAELIEDRVR